MTSGSSAYSSQAFVPVVTAFSSRAPAVTRAILMSDTGLLLSGRSAGRGGTKSRHETPADRLSMLASTSAFLRGGFASAPILPATDAGRTRGLDGTREAWIRGSAPPMALGAARPRRARGRPGRSGPAGPPDDGRQAAGRRRA